MPHCVVEHSINLDSDLLVQKVFLGALNTGLFEPDGGDIKVRAIGYNSYMTGPKKSDFIHVILKILSGRTPEQKLSLSSAVIEELAAIKLRFKYKLIQCFLLFKTDRPYPLP